MKSNKNMNYQAKKNVFRKIFFRVLNMESQSRETLTFSGSEYDLRKYAPILLFHCK